MRKKSILDKHFGTGNGVDIVLLTKVDLDHNFKISALELCTFGNGGPQK
jgi:hypothetical protein